MRYLMLACIYMMFFLSGAAALMYEVIWVRSLSLVFGGTHLAVTTVLSIFMGGLALGSYIIGKRVDAVQRPLRLYGYLEIGIALSALAFIALMKIYPAAYGFLAQGKDDYRLYLSLIRILFAVFALIVPTTFMGGTLPVLTRFASRGTSALGTQLSLLYGFNTLGAVAGAAAAGFYLLRYYSVSAALATAIAINFLIGLAGVFLPAHTAEEPARIKGKAIPPGARSAASGREPTPVGDPAYNRSLKLVLFGIGVSGFCALGYEVLWTRILTLTIGTSVYGFTIMLIAFLTGISLGSEAYGLASHFLYRFRSSGMARRGVLGFGAVQILIGVAALAVTVSIRDLPVHSLFLRDFFSSTGLSDFNARQWANMTLAFSYMVVPSFFMGFAFPLAGEVAASAKSVGRAVGSVLTYNTVGAILGSAVSGFVLIYAFGIERSLQLLTIFNMGMGAIVMLSLLNSRPVSATAGALMLAAVLYLVIDQSAFRLWDAKYFAIYRNNQPDAFDTPFKKQDAIANTDVLYYHEGINETISVIQPKGSYRAVLVNGKVVASSSLDDQQCQLTLGHLPMLLHKDPKRVLVVGLGTGMTAGAASIHPEVEELTLAEIEPAVLGAARTFGEYNNHVLDNPKLRIIINDGRNFLMTTKQKFDVITADPIHPWTQGSGYLYTEEYFKEASEHLLPGGIMCQWLPIYELGVKDLKSVVRTFSLNFKYTMAWLTEYDAEIIGSNSPLIIDEEELKRRISYPAVRDDLRRVSMGSARDFLSYFVMGTDSMTAFAKGGVVNTDDNLYLEFSTPAAVGLNKMGENSYAIAQYRESILPYLVPAAEGMPRAEQLRAWKANEQAAAIVDRARSLFLAGRENGAPFKALMAELDRSYPKFAPGRFLNERYVDTQSHIPALLQKTPLTLRVASGENVVVEISALIVRISDERAAVMFVDNAAKKIYGQRYLSGPRLDDKVRRFAGKVMADIQAVYQDEFQKAATAGKEFPLLETTLQRIDEKIDESVEEPMKAGKG